jgi:DNA-binding transcriptional LysR family regulator
VRNNGVDGNENGTDIEGDHSIEIGERVIIHDAADENPSIVVNDPDLAVRAALDGLGIVYTVEAHTDPFLRTGQLVRVLEDWSSPFEGLFLYYPGHRQVPVALPALMDMFGTARGSPPARGSLEIPFAAE